jgi:hypothetical protein
MVGYYEYGNRLLGSIQTGKILISWATIGLSGRTLSHGFNCLCP